MLGLMHEAIHRLQSANPTQEAESSTDEGFLSSIQQFLLDPAQFVAGNLRHHLVAWQLFFKTVGHSSKAASVLAWIQHGVPLDFIHPFSEQQQLHPRFKDRIQLVEGLLDKTLRSEHTEAFLDCDSPAQVQFANRVSCTYYQQFVLEQRDEL